MKLHILKTSALFELKRNVTKNIDNYLTGNFDSFFADPANLIELDIEIDVTKFAEFLPGNTNDDEVHNCLLMLEIFGDISPDFARDERLWVYLVHTHLLEYSRQRWELKKKENDALIKHIYTHFFAPDKRSVERDNAASRLWWIATLCNRVDELDVKDVLECLLYQSDVRASIIERPTTSQCLNVFSVITKKLSTEYKNGNMFIFERKLFRELMKRLNLFGGIKLLNTMKEDAILAFIDQEVSRCSA